jgi:ABC-type glycerol-3-phosphate transport system permease component
MTEHRVAKVVKRSALYVSIVITVLFSAWPLFIGTLEGFDIDLGPLFSGQGITFIGGVPFYSGGFHPNIFNFINAISLDAFPRLVLNTLTIDSLSIGMALAAGIPAAYFLARSSARGKSVFEFLVLALRTASPFALVIPLYLLFVQNGLWNTYFGVAVAYLAVDLPVAVWMLKGFFAEVPQEVYEAAEVSGASEGQIFRRVAIPHVAFGILATAIFTLVLLWNEFLFANLLTGGATKTVSVGIWTGAGENIGAFKSVEWDQTNMLGILAFVPAFLIVIAIRRYIARGFSYVSI